ncbi:MAG: 3-oxoacyl-[acyl-carrier-protein] reductase [Candidatus Contubernalis sp.]|nr:3-oxoacyl-[acyl-carrier-protein] reductase [Candidatus Contubernalis sp.]
MIMDKTCIVTGASRGIGRQIALTLAGEGMNVVINYVGNRDRAEETAGEVEKLGGRALVVKGDVASFKESEELIKACIDKFGKIDILINNAGITRDALIMRMKEEDWDKVISTNLKGAFNCSRAAVRYMMKQKSGRIINIASVVGISGNSGQANYAAAKAGVIGFTKSLAKEVASRGILVNAVAPGYIETEMTEVLGDEVREKVRKNIPLGRLGQTADIAEAVKFLSLQASYITGQVIVVDGGMTM